MSLILSGTDGLSDVDGSAATPALRGTDANTGIFFPAADTIAFSEGGVEAMRITSAGILDIGGTSGGATGELLVVEGANSAGHRAARINNTSTTNGYSTLWMGSSNDGLVRGGSTAGAFTDQLTLLTSGAIPISFYTSNTERMRIDSSGNLLVNTTTAETGAKLSVTGGISGTITSGTSVTCAGQTSIDFTSIPSWVKRITVLFKGVSTSGTSVIQVQLGDSGGVENTGYLSSSSTAGGTVTAITSGFAICTPTAASVVSGHCVITLIDAANTWVQSSLVKSSTTTMAFRC
jgi:hypothetical protein